MKRIISLVLTSILSLILLTGCATQNKNEDTNNNQQSNKKDLSLNIEERGEGRFFLTNATGTTESNNTIYEFLDSDDEILSQLSYESWGINSKKVSYIYLDGELVEKTVLGDTQSSLTLKGKSLEYGKHTVEVLQFKDGESLEDDNIGFYEKAQYIITNNAEEYEKGTTTMEMPENNSETTNDKEAILEEILQKAMFGEISPDEMVEEVKKQGITEKEFEEYTALWNETYGTNSNE